MILDWRRCGIGDLAPDSRNLILAGSIALAIACLHRAAGAQEGTAAAPVPPTIEALFHEAAISGAQMAPDGHAVAIRIGAAGRKNVLAVVDLKSLKPTPVAAYQDQNVEQFSWVGPHRLVYTLDQHLIGPGIADSAEGLFAVDDDGSSFRQLVQSQRKGFFQAPDLGRPPLPYNTFPLFLTSPPDDDTIYVEQPQQLSRKEGADYFRLLRLNTRTGDDTEIEVPLHSRGFVFDSNARLRAVTTVEKNVARVMLLDAQGQWQQIDEYDIMVGGGLDPLYVDSTGRLFISGAKEERNTRALYVYDTHAGHFQSKPLLATDLVDVYPELLVVQGRTVGLRYKIDATETAWLDPALKGIQAAVDKRLPGRVNEVSPPRSTASTDVVLVESYSDRVPPSYFLYDVKTEKLIHLGDSRAGIDPRAVGKTYFVHYKARDGMQIPAYITFPPGHERKDLPLVVLVHGGPFLRVNEWGWNSEVQFLASRGYAVLQPEFRGSTGFGYQLFQAGWRQWGQAMQRDIADGARWTVSEGMIDPGRICIMGASYGGYATLMGLARDPDLYRCGVAWAAVTDLRLLGSWAWGNTSDVYKKYGLPRLVGDPVTDAAMLAEYSPVENASRIRAPLLLAHGTYDGVVPLVHGERLRDLLRDHVGFEWIEYPEEPHGWKQAETRYDFFQRVEKFLDRYIGAGAMKAGGPGTVPPVAAPTPSPEGPR